MEHNNPHFDALDALHRKQAEIREQIRVSKETVEQSQELLGRIDDLLAKSPLKPSGTKSSARRYGDRHPGRVADSLDEVKAAFRAPTSAGRTRRGRG